MGCLAPLRGTAGCLPEGVRHAEGGVGASMRGLTVETKAVEDLGCEDGILRLVQKNKRAAMIGWRPATYLLNYCLLNY